MFSRHKDHTKMGSVRELQAALSDKENEAKIKDNRIHVLEAELRRKDDQIRKLESELDKYCNRPQPKHPNLAYQGWAYLLSRR